MFVKICGTTSEDDALLATAMGADAVGFVFAPSPRQVAPARVRDIVPHLPAEVMTVGVFRDHAREQVVEIVDTCGLNGAQLHGHERAEDCQWVADRVRFTIKAFTAGDPMLDHPEDFGAGALLIDSAAPGSGQVFDWSLAEGAPLHHRVILAGGLTPDNVAGAVERVHPWGVDVATGVEKSPGQKDPRKVKAFIEAARRAEPAPHESSAAALPYDWQEDG